MSKTRKQIPTLNRDHQNVLALLEAARSEYGYVPEKAIVEVAKSLDISKSDVYGVATFYSFLSTRPLGRNVIRVCKSLPCHLNNAPMIIETIGKELGIEPGETTPDNKFSFELTNCIGACDKAPAILVNSDVHGDLTPEKISQVLKSYD